MTSKPRSSISFFGSFLARCSLQNLALSDVKQEGYALRDAVSLTGSKIALEEGERGLKFQRLEELSQEGFPIPTGVSFTASFCQSLTSETQKPQKEAVLKALECFQGECFQGQKQNEHGKAQKITVTAGSVPVFLIARMSPPYEMSLTLPFVAGLGLNPIEVDKLEAQKGVGFAHYHYQRFIVHYSSLVWDIDDWVFEDIVYSYQEEHSLKDIKDYKESDWRTITTLFLKEISVHYGKTIPISLEQQCVEVLEALSKQWHSSKFKFYREIHNLADKPEPTIILQTIICSCWLENPHHGRCYSRNPKSGEAGLFGTFLALPHTALERLSLAKPCLSNEDLRPFERSHPLKIKLKRLSEKLEKFFKAAVEFDYIEQEGKVWILNARIMKADSHATIKIACDQVDERIITKAHAVCRPDPTDLSHLLHHSLKLNGEQPLLRAMPASLGASSGKVALDRHTALSFVHLGEDVILVRPETDPEDVYAIHSVAGVLTSQGGNSSHAAVIARSMGCPCVVGAKEMVFTKNETSLNNQSFSIGNHVFRNGDYITIDGKNGDVYRGKVALQEPVFPEELNRLLHWADELSTMAVRTNADSVEEAKCARNFGAKGIGLCRTEHMLLTPEALFHFRRVLLENDAVKKSAALQDILLDQKSKITKVLHEMAGYPVTIRLLDPPLHEFLPKDPVEVEALASILERPVAELQEIVKSLEEKNPMLGHRGCRLAITLPEILEIQTRAILEAAKDVYRAEPSAMPLLEIMIPFVMLESEIELIVKRIKTIADDFCKDEEICLNYRIGTMIEIPRAALRASTIAKHTDFFSFGTNDLTQTVWGLSRDDADSFLRDYYAADLLDYDPFKTLDIPAVGTMIAQACVTGKLSNPNLTLGICGEHGADPASITFFQSLGLDYISCSPFQVPIARLAAGQASIKQQKLRF